MKTVATIEARMGSRRLPGKVLLPANNRPMLEHLIRRLRRSPSINQIILATTTNKIDDVLEKFANDMDIMCYRGSENDVMQRVIEAAELACAKLVVEITGDCPLLDPAIVEQIIRIFKANNVDYVSNSQVKTYPIGMDVQVFKLETLRMSASLTKSRLDREHVTLHIRKNNDIFSRINVVAPHTLHWPELALTLDEHGDYLLLKKIIEHFGEKFEDFDCLNIINLLRENPNWLNYNNHIKRKGDN